MIISHITFSKISQKLIELAAHFWSIREYFLEASRVIEAESQRNWGCGDPAAIDSRTVNSVRCQLRLAYVFYCPTRKRRSVKIVLHIPAFQVG